MDYYITHVSYKRFPSRRVYQICTNTFYMKQAVANRWEVAEAVFGISPT